MDNEQLKQMRNICEATSKKWHMVLREFGYEGIRSFELFLMVDEQNNNIEQQTKNLRFAHLFSPTRVLELLSELEAAQMSMMIRAAQIKALESQLSKAVEVIQFYGDHRMWSDSFDDKNTVSSIDVLDVSTVRNYTKNNNAKFGGKRAREFLSQLENDK